MTTAAKIGGALWLLVTGLSFAVGGRLGWVEILFLLAPCVTVPLGMALTRHGNDRMLARSLPFGAVAAAASLWMPTGVSAASIAAVWLLICSIAALGALRSFLREPKSLTTATHTIAHVFLAGGAVWLMLSRFGSNPMGFQEPIVMLTAVHFHYTGFAAPILAAMLLRSSLSQTSMSWAKAAMINVMVATVLIAAGFVFSPLLQLSAIFLLVANLMITAVLMARVAGHLRSRFAQFLMWVASASVIGGMALALVYGLGEYTGHSYIGLANMAAFHGTLNAFGFTLCGLLAWNLAASSSRA